MAAQKHLDWFSTPCPHADLTSTSSTRRKGVTASQRRAARGTGRRLHLPAEAAGQQGVEATGALQAVREAGQGRPAPAADGRAQDLPDPADPRSGLAGLWSSRHGPSRGGNRAEPKSA